MKETNMASGSRPEKNDEIDFIRLLGTLLDDRWLIIIVTSGFFLLALCYVLLAQPVYRADALVQVEKTPGVSSLLDSVPGMLQETDPASSTETEIIKSRLVMGKAIADLNLDIDITRKQTPIIGPLMSLLKGSTDEVMKVVWFSVPGDLLNQPFEIAFTDSDHFTLSLRDAVVLRGQTGQSASARGISLFIAPGPAVAGERWTLLKHPFLETYGQLIKAFDVSDKGKDTGVLGLTYDSDSPEDASVVLNSIVGSYFLQNINRKTEQAQKSLDFLQQQLPVIKAQLDTSEQTLNNYRRTSGTVDLSLQARSLLDNVVQLDAQINQLTFRETDVAQLFTKDHPSYRALLEKKQILETEKSRLNKAISQLPMMQQEMIRLSRDVDVQQQVYVQMLNRQQELKVMKASTTGYVRIIDRAMTRLSPVKPMKLLVILFVTFIGFILAVCISLIRSALFRHIDSPDALERAGISVLASIPFSQWQHAKNRQTSAGLLATEHPEDLAVEALRSLRTGLHFTLMQARNNIMMVSGVSPGIGKSFISANLAAVLASGGKRTLLIDADLRKGYLHSVMAAGKNDRGLSDVLSGRFSAQECVIPVPAVDGLELLPRGAAPSAPAELLMKRQLGDLLAWASEQYDLVLLDTPPVLAVTDAAILGRYCGTSLLVVRFEENSVRQAEVSIRRFRHSGVDITGAVLNAVVKRPSSYYSADGHYQYDYRQ
ncbi:polysaccharide biosynthesis tyrosine autokinase [Lelliottia sp. V106_10]|uniref:polysaccharide biosynthesis tyrosine autokinase n=1 Tax=Lelliottia wanjuensis TaxID=3050585 RepID=UPI00254C0480|nr:MULTISPECIES: polysaccharide biosynthesis tyrosine autokinase [unclassified Lelliottia]MDK9358872.1 polysaccharide biosynthesis tyrosine autokinase [Lelliottia sp. V106_16]MDK9373559.1 polysaccharide biosynthesis tyrosine autokinase [Lelliottia sp. V106_10]MDK9600400.1 polysaccharide biosynthesis tyrosine autokinase [Lelliottia sp. V106_5]